MMKLLSIAPVLLIALPLLVSAEVYKTANSDGTVSYSDTPQKDSVKINVPDGGKFQSMISKVTLSDEAQVDVKKPKEEKSFEYEVIKFATPTDQKTFWNQQQIPVAIAITPNLRNGDLVQVTVDGVAQPPQPTNKFVLNGIVRGEHKLKATVLDSNGNTLKESGEVTIYIHFTTKKHAEAVTSQTISIVNKILPSLFR